VASVLRGKRVRRLTRIRAELFVWDQKRCDQFLRSIRREAEAQSGHAERPGNGAGDVRDAPVAATAGAPAR